MKLQFQCPMSSKHVCYPLFKLSSIPVSTYTLLCVFSRRINNQNNGFSWWLLASKLNFKRRNDGTSSVKVLTKLAKKLRVNFYSNIHFVLDNYKRLYTETERQYVWKCPVQLHKGRRPFTRLSLYNNGLMVIIWTQLNKQKTSSIMEHMAIGYMICLIPLIVKEFVPVYLYCMRLTVLLIKSSAVLWVQSSRGEDGLAGAAAGAGRGAPRRLRTRQHRVALHVVWQGRQHR